MGVWSTENKKREEASQEKQRIAHWEWVAVFRARRRVLPACLVAEDGSTLSHLSIAYYYYYHYYSSSSSSSCIQSYPSSS